MAGSDAYARIKSDVLAVAQCVPQGRVVTHKQIGGHLRVMSRHVAYILATLDNADRETVPWWRVVADGGAIGRHLRRDDQMARLRADGVVISPVGIVQDLRERWVEDIEALLAGRVGAIAPTPSTKPSRSRGMRDRPGS